MFNKNYKKALEIFDGEIEMYDRLFHSYLYLAKSSTMSEESKKFHLDKAREYCEMRIALLKLKAKIRKEIES